MHFKNLYKLLKSKVRHSLSSGSAAFFVHIKWSMVCALVPRTFNMVLSVILAKRLSSEEFGAYALIQAVVSGWCSLSPFGLDSVCTVWGARLQGNRSKVVLRFNQCMQLWSLLTGGGVTLFALFFHNVVYSYSALGSYTHDLNLSLISIVFITFATLQSALLASSCSFKQIAIAYSLGAASTVAGSLLLVGFYGLRGALIANILGNLITVACAGPSVGTLLKWSWRSLYRIGISLFVEQGLRTSLWSLALPSLANCILVAPVSALCFSLFVGESQSSSAVGPLRILLQWQAVLLFLSNAAAQPLLTMYSTQVRDGDLRCGTVLAHSLVGAFSASFLSITLWLSWPMLQVWYADKLNGKHSLLCFSQILLAYVIIAGLLPLGHAIIALGGGWHITAVTAFRAVCQVGFTSVLIEKGPVALTQSALWAYALCSIVLSFLFLSRYRRYRLQSLHC